MIAHAGNFEDEVALVAFAGKNHRAVLASFQDGFKAVETETALLLGWAVALEAIFFEDGPDVRGVGHVLLRGCRRQFVFGGEKR